MICNTFLIQQTKMKVMQTLQDTEEWSDQHEDKTCSGWNALNNSMHREIKNNTVPWSITVDDSPTGDDKQDDCDDSPTGDDRQDDCILRFVNRVFTSLLGSKQPLDEIYQNHHWN